MKIEGKQLPAGQRSPSTLINQPLGKREKTCKKERNTLSNHKSNNSVVGTNKILVRLGQNS